MDGWMGGEGNEGCIKRYTQHLARTKPANDQIPRSLRE